MAKHIRGEVHDHRHQAGGPSGGPHDLVQQCRGKALRGKLRHGGIQQSRQKLQVRLINGHRELDQLVEHLVVAEHYHQDEAALSGLDQVKPGNRCTVAPGGSGDGGKIGGLGNQLCHFFHQLIHALDLFLDGIVNGFCFIHAEAVILHQLIHIQPVTRRGRDPSGAGMGLLQITHGRQVRHFVPDRGRGEIHVRQLRDRLGAHRLRSPDIKVHHTAQHLLFPLGQLHDISSLALVLLEC